jgi:hypothetical protein
VVELVDRQDRIAHEGVAAAVGGVEVDRRPGGGGRREVCGGFKGFQRVSGGFAWTGSGVDGFRLRVDAWTGSGVDGLRFEECRSNTGSEALEGLAH